MQEDSDSLQVRRCQDGDTEALAELRQRLQGTLTAILLSRGASRTETEDLLEDLWSDCVPGDEERPGLLGKFSGRCSVQGWLATVATNRLIDLKRKQQRREATIPSTEEEGTNFFEKVAEPTAARTESELVELLRGALEKAFAACGAEGLLMLRLVYLHGLSQREVARLWNCHESKISRHLNQALEEIAKETLKTLKARDPWLKLDWQDFVDLCQTQEIGFL